MTVQLNNDGTLAITAMSLVEFLPEIEQAFHNGYMLDLDKNEGVPQSYGPMLVLTMFPVGEVEVSEIDTTEEQAELLVNATGNEIHTVIQQSEDAIAEVTDDRGLIPKESEAVKIDGRKKKTTS